MRYNSSDAKESLERLEKYLQEGGELLYPVDTGKEIGTSSIRVPIYEWVPVKPLWFHVEIHNYREDTEDLDSKIEVFLISPEGENEAWMITPQDAEQFRLSDILVAPAGWQKLAPKEQEDPEEDFDPEDF